MSDPDPESILIAHYQAVREEEMERIKQRDRYIVWFVTLAAAAAGVYTKDTGWWGLLAVMPFLGFVCGAMYAHTDTALGALSRWLRHTYSETLAEYRKANNLIHDLPHWDGSVEHRDFLQTLSFATRYFAVALLVLAVGGFCIFMINKELFQHFESAPSKAWALISVNSIFTVTGAVLPIHSWHQRRTNP